MIPSKIWSRDLDLVAGSHQLATNLECLRFRSGMAWRDRMTFRCCLAQWVAWQRQAFNGNFIHRTNLG